MLNAQELRLGNWVKYTGIGSKGTEDYIKISLLSADSKMNGYEGIPLTPEILKGCGFVAPEPTVHDTDPCDSLVWVYGDGRFLIRIILPDPESDLDDDPLYAYRSDVGMDWSDCAWMKDGYLHTLQNLIYALKEGEELEVNL